MTDILKRLKEATGSDRELDAAIFWKLFPGSKPNLHTAMNIPDYTASIDAALALVERMLPGWDLSLFHRHTKSGWMARVRSPSYDLFCTNIVDGEEHCVPSAPIAILAALFTALEAQDTTHD